MQKRRQSRRLDEDERSIARDYSYPLFSSAAHFTYFVVTPPEHFKQGRIMSHAKVLFGLEGRISRLTYFGSGLLLSVVTLVLIVGGMLILRSAGPWAVVGAALTPAGVVGAVWNTIALTVKRLHDLGLSGANAVWIIGLNVGGSVVGRASDELAVAFALASIGAGLWLILAPGQPQANEYGPIPARARQAPVTAWAKPD